ncbi:MAG: hypothetical protein A2075_11655 [Geobacteraceae bacterium GWC2_58_44]|nr:MAG: hypothetical protein A2075_11655 [Geobacteraceae bacterium GWC2_58_44]HBG08301.1 hypothetical protein [Geobacter sp.]
MQTCQTVTSPAALPLPEIKPLRQPICLPGQFLPPFTLRLGCRARTGQGRTAQASPLLPVLLVLLVALGWSSTALAEPVVSVFSNGRGGFTVMANNLNRVSEAEVSIGYQSDDQAPPRVSGAASGAQASIAVQADNPGSLTIKFKSSKPVSGQVLLATAQIRGTVKYLAAWLRNEKGTVETPEVAISNPTDEQLSAMAGRRPAPVAPAAARPAVKAGAHLPPVVVQDPPVPEALSAKAIEAPGREPRSRSISFSRRKSVLELFRAHAGERSAAALGRLFQRSDDIFVQEPPVLLSDGSAALRLTIRTSSEESPQFAIFEGNCTGLKVGDDGAWILEIVPARGSLAATVTVLSGGEMIEFPLAVAPPLELFDEALAGAGEAEYVASANRLALARHAAR